MRTNSSGSFAAFQMPPLNLHCGLWSSGWRHTPINNLLRVLEGCKSIENLQWSLLWVTGYFLIMFSGPKARCLVPLHRKHHTFYKYVSFLRLMSKGQSLLLVFSRALQFFCIFLENVPVSLQRSTPPTYQWEGSSSFATSQPLNPTAWRWLRWSWCSTVGLCTVRTLPWKEKKGEI